MKQDISSQYLRDVKEVIFVIKQVKNKIND